MEQGFASRNRNDRGRAFVHRRETLLRREMGAKNLAGMLDLPAAATGEIAAEERFEHQHERVPAVAPEPLHGDMPEHGDHLTNWNTHANGSLLLPLAERARQTATSGK